MITEKTNSCRYFNGSFCTICGSLYTTYCEPCKAFRDKSEPKAHIYNRAIDPVYDTEEDAD